MSRKDTVQADAQMYVALRHLAFFFFSFIAKPRVLCPFTTGRKREIMKFSAVALVVLSSVQQADAFVVKPTSAPRESLALNALPTKIKKGEKVKTAVDFGGLVSSLVRNRTLSGSNLLCSN